MKKFSSHTGDHGTRIRNRPVSSASRISNTCQKRFPDATPPSVGKVCSGALLEVADSLGDVAVVNVAGIDFHETLERCLAVASGFLCGGHFIEQRQGTLCIYAGGADGGLVPFHGELRQPLFQETGG